MLVFLSLFILYASAQNLLDLATTAGLTSIRTAVATNGLDGTLSGPGPFTVFAPTNAAFTAAGVDINTASTAVADVLKYHVLSGNVSANQITNNQAVMSVLGPRLFFNLFGGDVYVNGVNVTAPNNYATNGVVHVIGKVLTPPTRTIVQLAAATDGLSTLASLVGTAGLFNDLNGSTVYTVFAPTNAAFAALPTCLVNYLVANPTVLRNVLLYHTLPGSLFSSNIPAGAAMVTPAYSADGNISVRNNMTGVFLNNAAQVQTADILALNGVVHLINQVIVPSGLVLTCAPTSSATAIVAPWLLVGLSALLALFL